MLIEFHHRYVVNIYVEYQFKMEKKKQVKVHEPTTNALFANQRRSYE